MKDKEKQIKGTMDGLGKPSACHTQATIHVPFFIYRRLHIKRVQYHVVKMFLFKRIGFYQMNYAMDLLNGVNFN